MIEYKLVNAIANVESKAGDGSQGGGGSGGGTTNDLKLAVQFTLFSNDSEPQTGVDSLEEDGTYLFKLATATVGLETIAKGTIKFYGSKTTLQKPKTEFEYIPGRVVANSLQKSGVFANSLQKFVGNLQSHRRKHR